MVSFNIEPSKGPNEGTAMTSELFVDCIQSNTSKKTCGNLHTPEANTDSGV